ncbi:putative membrane protein [Rhizomicrobium palustre]|uniref:Putative membrane protein n=1 Tax=Rhizomicrobium palustre TaxID=189966 RepID=A0A846MVR1_9PROT|nr:hypothetical protein [Rhizomicrobium palustre]NIK87172.1 putative membrane protein [Rhizomicrobium palustre]
MFGIITAFFALIAAFIGGIFRLITSILGGCFGMVMLGMILAVVVLVAVLHGF